MVSTSDALNIALGLHHDGSLAQAQEVYLRVLSADPRNADAWLLSGLAAHQQGDSAQAIERIARAIQLDGTQASFHHHLAEVYRAANQIASAEASYREALRLKPDFAVSHHTLGTLLTTQGKFQEAVESFRKALEHQHNLVQAHSHMGAALHSLGQLSEAVACYRRALRLNPDLATIYGHLGHALRDQGNNEEAIDAYRQAVRIDPGVALAEYNLGIMLHTESRLTEAADCYHRALAIDPRLAEVHCNLGSLLKKQDRLVEAAACYERALAIKPGFAEAHYNLGTVLKDQGRYAEAATSFERALRIHPKLHQAHLNLGIALEALGQWDAASRCYLEAVRANPQQIDAYDHLAVGYRLQNDLEQASEWSERALRIAPKHAGSHLNRALVRLIQGEFARGWIDYEYRWQCPGSTPRSFNQPAWQGESLAGRALFVHDEQGLGDTLQFVRYVKLLQRQRHRVICEVPPELLPLLELTGIENLVPAGAELPAFDVYAPLLSLPRILGTTLSTIPGESPYLVARPDLVEQWQVTLHATRGFKVGIAWQGSPSYPFDRDRSIPLANFAPLALAGVELISLQKGHGVEQLRGIEFPVRELGNEFDSRRGAFMDTAAVMRNLDLVVTSDTAIAHLAGALGVRVWTALPVVPDWRWLLNRGDSPWYPTMRLFRQSKREGWHDVFRRMAAELSRQMAESR